MLTTLLTARRLVPVAGTVLLAAGLSSGCGDHTNDTSKTVAPPVNTTTAPAELGWEPYRGVRLPRSPVDGPTRAGQAVTSGYRQTPQGAVLAAIRGQAYLALATDTEWGDVLAILTAPGPGRNEYAAQRAPLSVSGAVPADLAPRFLAFKVSAYHQQPPVTAAVQVVEQVGNQAPMFAYPVALQWLGDDWRIVLPTSDENIDAIEVGSLDGYTRLEG